MPALFDSVTAAYSVRALADPQLMGRLLGLFAQQDLVPASVKSTRSGDRLSVHIRQPSLSERRAEVIAAKMRALVPVESVALECQVSRSPTPSVEEPALAAHV